MFPCTGCDFVISKLESLRQEERKASQNQIDQLSAKVEKFTDCVDSESKDCTQDQDLEQLKAIGQAARVQRCIQAEQKFFAYFSKRDGKDYDFSSEELKKSCEETKSYFTDRKNPELSSEGVYSKIYKLKTNILAKNSLQYQCRVLPGVNCETELAYFEKRAVLRFSKNFCSETKPLRAEFIEKNSLWATNDESYCLSLGCHKQWSQDCDKALTLAQKSYDRGDMFSAANYLLDLGEDKNPKNSGSQKIYTQILEKGYLPVRQSSENVDSIVVNEIIALQLMSLYQRSHYYLF